LQKRTARLILDQDPIAPSELLFKQPGWMTIEQRIKYHKYLLSDWILFFKYTGASFFRYFEARRYL
jgi:hypothetical protein